MTITKNNANNKTIFLLEGRLDTTTAPQLQEVLIPEFDVSKDIILDFNTLAYVSSAGLRVLLMGQKTATAKGGSIIITGVSEEIMEVFEMTGFSSILTIE